MVRLQAFWEGWLADIGTPWARAPSPIPTDAGLGRFLADLAADQVQYETLPVTLATPTPTAASSSRLA